MPKFLVTLETYQIILVAIFGVLFITTIIILIYYLFIRNKKLINQVKSLTATYQNSHEDLEQCDKYLSRIEYIAVSNLLFKSYENYRHSFNSFKVNNTIDVGKLIDNINVAIDAKKYTSARHQINDVKIAVDDYQKSINNLLESLKSILKEENEILAIKEKTDRLYDDVKKYNLAHANELKLVKDSFNLFFKNIESKLKKFKTYLDCANYDDARTILDLVTSVLTEVSTYQKDTPQICARITMLIPGKISDLKNEIKKAKDAKIPFDQFVSQDIINGFEKKLKLIEKSLKSFYFNTVKDNLESIEKDIDDIFEKLNKEKSDAKLFNEKINDIFKISLSASSDYIRLTNSIPKIQLIYNLPKEKIDEVNKIRLEVNKLNMDKLIIENLMHNSMQKPYSEMIKSLLKLEKLAETINEKIKTFKNYLKSIKKDVEDAYGLLEKSFNKVKEAETYIYNFSNRDLINKFNSDIELIYSKLDLLHDTLFKRPINLDAVNDCVKFLKFDASNITNTVRTEHNMMEMSESLIVYCNRLRRMSDEIDAQSLDLLDLFYKGKYESAYQNANLVIDQYNHLIHDKK